MTINALSIPGQMFYTVLNQFFLKKEWTEEGKKEKNRIRREGKQEVLDLVFQD